MAATKDSFPYVFAFILDCPMAAGKCQYLFLLKLSCSSVRKKLYIMSLISYSPGYKQ
jgi:hypothetical protein